MVDRRIKVWLLDLPPLFAEMVTNALGEDVDFEWMAADEHSGLEWSERADALLTGRLPADVERLLMARPKLQAFVVSHDGRSVTWVRLRPVQDELGELTFAGLASAVKRSMQPPLRAWRLGGRVRGRARRSAARG